MLNEYFLRYLQFCAFALFAICAFALFAICDGYVLRYCDIVQQIADRNVADSCRRIFQRQSSLISNLLCALMIKLNDWIDY